MRRKQWTFGFFLLAMVTLGIWFYASEPDLGKATPQSVDSGKKIFAERCATCHGPDGGGLVGPNLTDDYWIQGDGSESAILSAVKKGVPERGMPPWETVLSSGELAAVVHFTASLRNTSPSHPKPPQGEKREVNPQSPKARN